MSHHFLNYSNNNKLYSFYTGSFASPLESIPQSIGGCTFKTYLHKACSAKLSKLVHVHMGFQSWSAQNPNRNAKHWRLAYHFCISAASRKMQYFLLVFFSRIFINNIIILLTLCIGYHMSTKVLILGLWFLMVKLEIVGFCLPQISWKLFDTLGFFYPCVYSTGGFTIEFRISSRKEISQVSENYHFWGSSVGNRHTRCCQTLGSECASGLNGIGNN